MIRQSSEEFRLSMPRAWRAASWIVAAVAAVVFAAHVPYYWLNNGICWGGGTGIINYIPTIYAGSLPYLYRGGIYPTPAIDPTAIQPTMFDFLWLPTIIFAFTLTAICLFRRSSQGWKVVSEILPWIAIITVCIGVYEVERCTSCNLLYTHKNIQLLFNMSDNSTRVKPKGVTSTVEIKNIDVAPQFKLVQLQDSDGGEPSAGAYVVKLPRPLSESISVIFPSWLSLAAWEQQPNADEILPVFDAIARAQGIPLENNNTGANSTFLLSVTPFTEADGMYASIISFYVT